MRLTIKELHQHSKKSFGWIRHRSKHDDKFPLPKSEKRINGGRAYLYDLQEFLEYEMKHGKRSNHIKEKPRAEKAKDLTPFNTKACQFLSHCLTDEVKEKRELMLEITRSNPKKRKVIKLRIKDE